MMIKRAIKMLVTSKNTKNLKSSVLLLRYAAKVLKKII
jgi:hypothetical protein